MTFYNVAIYNVAIYCCVVRLDNDFEGRMARVVHAIQSTFQKTLGVRAGQQFGLLEVVAHLW
jgi:hypothetical protein